MSADLLALLAERVAFDGSPSFNDLGAYHVEFDQLTGSGRVEARLADAVRRGERTALIAPSGSGKTSVISHVLGPTAEGVAPIVIPVHSLGERAGDVAAVVDELLMWFTRSQATISRIDPDELDQYASGDTRRITRSHRLTTGVSLALGWFKGDLSKDLVAQVQYDQRISLAEKAATVDVALRRIHGDALQPVIVFDDTDRWTTAGDDVEVVANFFGEIIRWFTEFPASIVVATHSRYFDLGIDRQDLLQFLDTRVEIPALPHPDALHEILDRRVALNVIESDFEGAEIADAFEDDVVAALFKFYKSGVPLRTVVTLVHSALAEATLAGDSQVSAAHINAARTR